MAEINKKICNYN